MKIRAGGQEEPEREEILEPLEEPTPERRKEPIRETIPETEPERIPTRMGAAALPLGVVLIALSKVYKVTSKRELNRANLDRAMQSNLDGASKQRREALLRAATSLVAPHDFRHTCFTLLSKDVNTKVVSAMLGHASISVTSDS